MFNGIDSSASYIWLGYLVWKPYDSTSGGESWGGGTSTTAGYIEKTYTVNHTVNNLLNKYWVYIYQNPGARPDQTMYGARVTYTYTP